MIKKAILTYSLFCSFTLLSQINFKVPDSLKNKKLSWFSEKLDQNIANKEVALIYANSYLLKAKSEKKWIETVNAFENILNLSETETRLIYADSIIYYAKKSTSRNVIAAAFLTKGVVYFNLKHYVHALENYQIAASFVSDSDKYLIYKIKFSTAQIKLYLGYYNDALSLFNECVQYFSDDRDKPFFSSLYNLSLSYNKVGKYELCTATNTFGIQESEKYGNDMRAYFIYSEGINQVSKSNYIDAIQKLQEALPVLIKDKDFANETVANFNIGKSYWKLNQKENALPFLEKVDSVFTHRNFIRPDLLENFELLVTYYTEKQNPGKLLQSINQLYKVQNSVVRNFKYLDGKIDKQYTAESLRKAKAQVEMAIKNQTRAEYKFNAVLFIFLLLLIGATGIAFFQYRTKRKKLKYQNLDDGSSASSRKVETKKMVKDETLDINPEIITTVNKGLDKYEKNSIYRNKDQNLTTISEYLKVNSKYVSKIIYHYKDKSPVDYINDLKIELILTLLDNEPKLRNYSFKSLGAEAGFKNPQHFLRAFEKFKGIPFQSYLEQLYQIQK